MSKHETIIELLPLFVSGKLSENESAMVQQHLRECDACWEEVVLWEEVSLVMAEAYERKVAPPAVLDQALDTIREREGKPKFFLRSWQVVRAQVPLVRKEIWPASLLILVLGFVVTLIADKAAFIYVLAPLVSAGGLAFIYGGEHDPAHELVLSTPISQIQILLARSVLVFGYNFLITVVLSWGLSLHYSSDVMLPLMLDWLAPMTFLSSLGLCISIISNSENAIFVSYFLWLGKYLILSTEIRNVLGRVGEIFVALWQTPVLLYLLSGGMLVFMMIYVQGFARINRRLV
jgi:hypothetical protein